MSNLERDPAEVHGGAMAGRSVRERTPQVEVMSARDVPLGGPRAMTVRRTLPQRARSLIGAWCFVDHYGPDDVAETGGMSVAPHPHTGLQTVSWLFTGEIEHRDSTGVRAMVRPGELNLMTAGHGVSHSQVSTATTSVLHGAQLWVALPDEARDAAPRFDHYAPPPVAGAGWAVRVFLGSLLGRRSPVATATPLLGAELQIDAGVELELDVDPDFEHGLLVDLGLVSVHGHEVRRHELAYAPAGSRRLRIEAHEDSRLLLLGGPPFGEPIVMWWNFVGRSHDEVVGFRSDWQEQLGDPDVVVGDYVDGRFGVPISNDLPPIPAPRLPNVRLRERR